MSPDYHIARQRHLGAMLDLLQDRDELSWEFVYDNEHRKAEWHIAIHDGRPELLETRRAEELVQGICDHLGIEWVPVRHPGGEAELKDALRESASRKASFP